MMRACIRCVVISIEILLRENSIRPPIVTSKPTAFVSCYCKNLQHKGKKQKEIHFLSLFRTHDGNVAHLRLCRLDAEDEDERMESGEWHELRPDEDESPLLRPLRELGMLNIKQVFR